MLLDRSRTVPSWLPLWTAGVLAVASFHMLEHVVQTYQAYVLGSDHAHGLLGQYVDSDWIHLGFNTAFMVSLLPVAAQGGPTRSLRWQLFLGGLAAAGYHVVEHAAKTWQAMAMGHDPALGIAGNYGPLIPIHLWLNLTVYLLVLPHLLAWVLRLRRTGLPAVGRATASRAP